MRETTHYVDLLTVLNVAIKAVRAAAKILSPGSITGIRVMNVYDIHKIKCKKLHEYRKRKLISLVIR